MGDGDGGEGEGDGEGVGNEKERGRERERQAGVSVGPRRRSGLRSGPIDQGTLVLAGLTRCYTVFVHLVKTIGAIKTLRGGAHVRPRPPARAASCTVHVILV